MTLSVCAMNTCTAATGQLSFHTGHSREVCLMTRPAHNKRSVRVPKGMWMREHNKLLPPQKGHTCPCLPKKGHQVTLPPSHKRSPLQSNYASIDRKRMGWEKAPAPKVPITPSYPSHPTKPLPHPMKPLPYP